MKASLVLDSGKQKGRETRLAKGVYLVGRSKACQIRPKHRSVSRKHCAIINRGHRIEIQDIGSKTGTYINNERIALNAPVEIGDGDQLRIGRTCFRFEFGQNGLPANGRRARNGKKSKRGQDAPSDVSGPAEHVPAEKGANVASPPAEASEPTAADILQLLQDEDASSKEREFSLSSKVEAEDDAHVDLEDSDSGVDFLAPGSGASVGDEEDVPSYQLRQDWDVQGVQKWVAQGQVAEAPAPVLKSTPAAPVKKARPQRPKTNALASIDGDFMQITGVAVAVVVFVFWIAWNIWKLYSFQG